jgi:regulator of nucleoside diphosphate kinase
VDENMTITNLDARLLSALIRSRLSYSSKGRRPLLVLYERLERAFRVEEISGEVVTMYSVLLVRELGSSISFCLALVFPWEANLSEGRLSILSPLGSVVLGRREGEVVVCRDRRNTYQFRIEEVVFQPETALFASAGRT